jgi:hypothetical protein
LASTRPDHFSFEYFKSLACLVINKKSLSPDWVTITNGIVLIPSLALQKIVINTENLSWNQFGELVSALKLMKQDFVSVEIRSDSFKMDAQVIDG